MSIYDTHKPAGGGQYFKIEPGQTIKFRIASEPAIFEAEQKDGSTSTKYAWIVWNQDEQVAQILQMGSSLFRALSGLAQDDDWGDPMNYDIKMKRTGAGLETRYETNPNPNRDPLPQSALDEIASIDLIEKIAASPYAQHVMWVSDFDNPNQVKTAPGVGGRKTQTAPDEPNVPTGRRDTVVDDIGDEPINLDDIPF